MSDKVYLGREMAQLDISPALAPVSRVVLLVDDETAYTAGDDTGRTVEVVCPYGTQAMASNILAGLRAYTYTPLQAQDALLDPAAELGDGLTAGGVYTMLGRIDLEWDALMASDSGAPGKAEQENEYQYRSPVIAGLNYQISQTRSQITKTAEEIRLEVSNEIEGLSASISVRLDSITSTIQDQAGKISQIQQTINSITLSVSNGSTSSSITLSVGGVAVSSQTIQMNGLVTFTGLANGTTTINGGCIKTGLIDADRLNLTGAITFSDLSSSVQNDIDNALYTAQDAYDLAYDNQLPTYIKSTYIDSTRIESPEIYAGEFYGNEFNIYPESGDSGSFNLYNNFRGGTGYHILEISYWEELAPYVRFDSPASAYAQWAFPNTQFFGNLDFSGANVSGLTMSSRAAAQPMAVARASAEKPAKTVELLVGDDGRLEVVLPDGTTWYLDENGWTKG